MNINELGQLFVTGISGLGLEPREGDFLEEANIGGVVLYSRNFKGPAQLAELVNEIQKRRDEWPLFVAVDQEGGENLQFKNGFVQLPSMSALGAADSPKLTFEAHQLMASELSACGVNLDFSPCCDIWSNPKNTVIGKRAFGKDSATVEKHVSAAIRGLHAGNVLACAKHFPGHGAVAKDSHSELPFDKATLEQLESSALKPFLRAAKSRVEFMMIAHIVVDAIDPDAPASLSPKAYKFCREKLKYKKIIITDELGMGAIAKERPPEEAAIEAFRAGADMALFEAFEDSRRAYGAVKEALRSGKLSLAAFQEKIERVKTLKKAFLSEYKPVYIPSISKVIRPENQKQLLDKIPI